ncbi:MAG TPA: SIMPL domain-containing protein [Pyrinomonadaceae bacterium]|nr:SIMPL domain-containing protein [Pyrinomonadaceae bacterium]
MKRLLMTTWMITLMLGAATVLQAQPANPNDNRRGTRVTVTGDAVVQAQPDTAILMISVVTQGRRALDAQQENATKTDAVVQALKTASGTGAEVKTSGYSVQPMRVYRENQPPTISGYEVRNTVTVTMSDLKKLGNVIDVASQTGANDISGISFTLRQDKAAREQALADATREAMTKAETLARALGKRVVRVVEVQEEGFQRPPVPVYQAEAFMAKRDSVATPIEVGSLDITSRVQLIAEVE